MNDAEILARATNPDGSRRFHSPNEHPATTRLRDALARAEEIGPEAGEATEKYINHLRSELAKFEAGEGWAKREYLRASRQESA